MFRAQGEREREMDKSVRREREKEKKTSERVLPCTRQDCGARDCLFWLVDGLFRPSLPYCIPNPIGTNHPEAFAHVHFRSVLHHSDRRTLADKHGTGRLAASKCSCLEVVMVVVVVVVVVEEKQQQQQQQQQRLQQGQSEQEMDENKETNVGSSIARHFLYTRIGTYRRLSRRWPLNMP